MVAYVLGIVFGFISDVADVEARDLVADFVAHDFVLCHVVAVAVLMNRLYRK
ncbi:MAG: hypothetical protein ACTS2F_29920 [Thainema sp.]